MRLASSIVVSLAVLVFACTGGSGPIDGDGGASSSSSGSSSGPSSGGGGKQISASDFEQGCVNENDCVAVFQGDVCNTCKCQNAAIAKTDLSKYESASSTDECRNQQPCAADCQEARVQCLVGKCALAAPGSLVDAGGD